MKAHTDRQPKRVCRLQRAQEILDYTAATPSASTDRVSSEAKDRRAQTLGELPSLNLPNTLLRRLGESDDIFSVKESPSADGHSSSEIAKPRYNRLIQAASARLAKRMEVASEQEHDTVEVFTSPDAIGGGTQDDVFKLLTVTVESLGLTSEDIARVILVAFKVMSLPELPWSALTWRPMLITSLAVAIQHINDVDTRCKDTARRRLSLHARHFWPGDRIERACNFVQELSSYRMLDLGRSAILSCYFELREEALRMNPDDCKDKDERADSFSRGSWFGSDATSNPAGLEESRSEQFNLSASSSSGPSPISPAQTTRSAGSCRDTRSGKGSTSERPQSLLIVSL